jgi:hypothetical protein
MCAPQLASSLALNSNRAICVFFGGIHVKAFHLLRMQSIHRSWAEPEAIDEEEDGLAMEGTGINL